MKNSIVALLALVAAAASGCSYGGIAVAPTGTVYIARNDHFLFGALRHVYACQPNGSALTCEDSGAP